MVTDPPRNHPRPRHAAQRGSAWAKFCFIVAVLSAVVAGGVAWSHFNPTPYLNPPTSWSTPSDAQLQNWERSVQMVTAWHDGFFTNGERSAGSGFFLSGTSLVTAGHVAHPGGDVNALRFGSSPSGPTVSVIHDDPAEDVAVLAPQGRTQPAPFTINVNRPARGEHLWVLCAPGVNSVNSVVVSEFTVAEPTASATLHGANGATTYVQDLIAMTGGAIVPGCSGSPIVNGSGEVVGMADGGIGCETAGPSCQLDAVPSQVFAAAT